MGIKMPKKKTASASNVAQEIEDSYENQQPEPCRRSRKVGRCRVLVVRGRGARLSSGLGGAGARRSITKLSQRHVGGVSNLRGRREGGWRMN